MSFTISVYQRKRPGELEWHTLGLGALSTTRVGTSPTKLQRAIADDLKKAIRKMKPEAAAALELVRGRRLVRARVDVSFGGRGRVSGLFPVVLEPRVVAPGRTATIAYHPLRQDDWVVAEEPALEDALRRFWSWAWRRARPGVRARGLTTDGKDSLRAFSFEEPLPRLIDQLEEEEDPWADLEIDPKRDKKRKRRYGRNQLKAVGANVTLRVADRTERLGRPREPWRSQLAELATGPRKRSMVLVGPPGVGKSTILVRWVADLLEADDFGAHRNLDRVHEVWRVSSRRILAGMSHFGEWEERCLELAHEASDPRVVLWAEDLHTFGRAGRTRDSDRTIADVLRGPLLRGEVTIVGESTEGEWQRLVEDAPGFADLFTVLRVTEADPSETQALLVAEARELEAARRVRFEPSAYRAITSLGEALHPGTARPGVTVDLLRRLADEHAAEASEVASVDASRVIAFLSRRTGLPEVLLSPDGVLSVDELSAQLGQHVLGQPEAIEAAVDLVARIRAGLTDAERPYASYLLFTGPTGTGKTQMARAIAGFLYGGEQRLVRVDMGEMSGPDAVARLIGDRFDPRGMLTDAVRQQPFCVVLLDEIEKAHPAVLQLLLQLLDEGRLTDAAGETADFRRSVIVMTSNLGARPRAAVGFGDSADAVVRDVDRAVREFFPPELFNRIDRVVSFRPLTPQIAERVAEKELAQLLARRGLTDRRVFVFAEDEAVRRMAREAFDARDGARSVKRYLEDRIGGLLADELAGAAARRCASCGSTAARATTACTSISSWRRSRSTPSTRWRACSISRPACCAGGCRRSCAACAPWRTGRRTRCSVSASASWCARAGAAIAGRSARSITSTRSAPSCGRCARISSCGPTGTRTSRASSSSTSTVRASPRTAGKASAACACCIAAGSRRSSRPSIGIACSGSSRRRRSWRARCRAWTIPWSTACSSS
ncbi:MAG: AAA family ATPase [Sandaracinaceae bacterium]|nr:AAA family ATPase [Sandaracinaceae bacterium]